MSNNSGLNNPALTLFLAGLRLYVGEKDYKKMEMIVRMTFEEDYLMKCDYHFTGKKESIDCVIEDNHGNATNFTRRTDSDASLRLGRNGSTDVSYDLSDFTIKIRTYKKPYKGAYFKMDVFTKEGPTLKRKEVKGK